VRASQLSRVWAAVGLGAAGLLLISCEGKERAAPGAPAAVAQPVAPAPPPSLDPREGESSVQIEAGGVTLLAKGAHRREILTQLSRQARFDVEDHTQEDPELTLRVIRSPLAQAIAATLAGTPYTLHYAGQAPHDLRLLEVGVAPQASTRKRQALIAELERRMQLSEDEREELEKERKRLEKGEEDKGKQAVWRTSPQLTPEQRSAWQAARAQRQVEYRAETLAELESEIGEDRKFALASLDPTRPEDVARITAALEDVDASVRSEAANQLRWAAPDLALPALTAALRDGSPEVVLQAIESLADFDDDSVASRLRELSDHEDPRVRAAADRERARRP
jgi:hypothetical protein